jgi:DNA-3-methyladenine glycosylase
MTDPSRDPGSWSTPSTGPGRDEPQPWSRRAFERPSVELARLLLGALVVRDGPDGRVSGLIVETEAYAGPEDRASHARAGLTRRTAPMFGPPGHAYVYLVYGLHHCLNVVSGPGGSAGAVLIRAVAPVDGLDAMRRRRGGTGGAAALLAAGPARLCQALAIDRTLDGHDLTTGRDLWITGADAATAARMTAAGVVSGPRVGVAYAGDDWAARPWRFGVRGHPSLSRPFPAAPPPPEARPPLEP